MLAVQESRYHLVLMDMHMPIMDGLAATRAIRQLAGRFESLPILALTASVQGEQVRRCLDAGMNGHLGKPILIPALIAALAHWPAPADD